MAQTFVVDVMEGDYGLVSMDIPCIESILYLRLNKLQVRLNELNGVKSCTLYRAPTLRDETSTLKVYTFPKIEHYVKTQLNDIDKELSDKEASETLAMRKLIEMRLKPVLDFTFWIDARNCDEFTTRWFMKSLPFLFNHSYVKRKKNEAAQLIETLYPMDSDVEVVKDFLVKSATQTLSILSTRLGRLNFFHGEQPTSLDVVVYGHIAPLVKIPFPSNDVAILLSMWPNLVEFVKRIDAKYLPDVKRGVKYLKSEETNRQSDDDVSYLAIAIMFVGASSLVLGFILKGGLSRFAKF